MSDRLRSRFYSCGASITLLPAMTRSSAVAVAQAAISSSTPDLCPFATSLIYVLRRLRQQSRTEARKSEMKQHRNTPYATARRLCSTFVPLGGWRGGVGLGPGFLHATRVCYERNIVRNTLADTPSGYIQDPRVYPTMMPRYDSVSRVGAATLEAMERERELLEREELAYPGYTTLRIQELKKIVINKGSTKADLQHAADALREELSALLDVVGQEVEKPMNAQRLLLLKWQQRQTRLQNRENGFQVNVPSTPAYRVVLQADGTEIIERPGRDTPQGPVHETDDAYLSQAVEAEELPPEALISEKTVITTADVNHVRYLLGLTYRRLERCDEAERILYDILDNDVANVDAIESLLELYTGIEGWVPRIRVLLDYLTEEHTKAIEEGRRSPASAFNEVPAVDAHGTEDAYTALSLDAAAASTSTPPQSSSSSSSVSPTDTVATTTGTSVARRPTRPYATLPQVSPVEVALSLLSDLIVEAAAQKCSSDGEGAASRFFIEAMGPIVRVLDRDNACRLLEALFRAVDEQHFVVRFDSDDISPAARTFALSLVIAFLKALMARRIHEILPESTRFHFFTLVKLHTALRSAGRVHESYKICEDLMQLYRSNSSVHRTRVCTSSSVARRSSSPSLLQAECRRILGAPAARLMTAATAEVEAQRGASEAGALRPQATNAGSSPAVALKGVAEEVPPTEDRQLSEPPDILDDQDANYREAFFQYVSDRAHDSPALGRHLCMEAMAEFPMCAAPWETLALLMHKEDPERNLSDAIIAARRAMELEPFNVRVIVMLANFYKAAHRYELCDRMMDRYRLMSYMVEEGASEADMVATAAEIAALDEQTPEAQDLVEETGRAMKEFLERMEQATTYSMPIDKEPRLFRDGPIRFIAQQPDMRPGEVAPRDKELLRQIQMMESRQQQ
ncbi:hypothetical protein, conserved [Leishmania tarentolae]|uniref:Uncharacterized protein n=1 Tax=Leishmania tarentolae TaxID=5689 RepID=A0A640KMT1_LEITA|nr:hypothetical protein, conserved [Leishmania tarentolae]